ncbi:MAG: hypothetical protein ACRD03_15255 [Acidimicrobiales bacterium]
MVGRLALRAARLEAEAGEAERRAADLRHAAVTAAAEAERARSAAR